MAYTLRKNGQLMQGLIIRSNALSFTKEQKAKLNRRAKVNGYVSIEEWIISRILSDLGCIEDRLPIWGVSCAFCGFEGDSNEEDWCPKCEKYFT